MAWAQDANGNDISTGGNNGFDSQNLLQAMQYQNGSYAGGPNSMTNQTGQPQMFGGGSTGDRYFGTDLNTGTGPMGMGGSNNSLLQPGIRSIQSNNGGMNGLLQQLIGQYQTPYNNLMNAFKGEQKSVLGSGGLYAQAQQAEQNIGKSQMEQLKLQQKNDLGAADQSAVSRGLGNTSIRQSMLNGVNQSSQLAQNNLSEGIGQQKANLLQNEAGAVQNLGGQQTNMLQNQASQYMNLIAALARGSGGR